jgi:peptidyl-prolyl cis-trans isomerase B (cyclophilin B)
MPRPIARRLPAVLASLAISLGAFAQAPAAPPVAEPAKPTAAPVATPAPAADETVFVLMKTSQGEIVLELNRTKAPLSVENFLKYANKGYYDGTVFHRVIDGFMIQGGGFEPGMKQKPTMAPIKNEASNGLKNRHYTLAMARTSDPHSATAQFFINTTDNGFLDFKSESPQGWGYAVFGKVVAGTEVVDAIEKAKTGRKGFHDDVPLEDVVITRAVEIG